MSRNLEVWQRGPLPEISPMLQPVAHALLQAREEVELHMHDFPDELLWLRPAGLPSTVIGLLVHGAEHTMRHLGQLIVTATIVKNGGT